MYLTTDYVTAAINGYRVSSLAQSALPNAPIVPDPERVSFLSRVHRMVASAARLFANGPSPSTQSESVPARG